MTILEMLELLKELENVEILYDDKHNCTEIKIYYKNNIVVSALEIEKDQIYVCYYFPRLTDETSYYTSSFSDEIILRNKQNIEVINLNVIDIEKWYNEIKNSLQMYDKEKARCLELLEEIKELRMNITDVQKFEIALKKKISVEKDFNNVFEG